jgi:hypothetical protein
MKKAAFLFALFVASTATLSAQPAASYQIDLVPSGKMLAIDQPVLKGSSYQFHSYPSGTLVSVRRSQIKYVSKITPEALEATYAAVAIGNLAMQGGTSQAGAANANTVKSKAAPKTPELGQGFYSNLKMGESLAPDAAAANDYTIGRTYAYAPSNASQSSPGAPPTNPAVTGGSNPPTMSSAADGTKPQ